MISIAAFPKCWLEDIVKGRMSLFNWIDTSTELECDGLELYSGFLESYKNEYLRKVRNKIESLGMTAPMMCYSPDFTIPDSQLRKKEVEKQIEIIRVTAELGGSFSAEHGIGQSKLALMRQLKDPGQLAVMRVIKRALDPHNIMNPGKMVPDA